ncbi:hypothetical protein DTO164E3_1067 [Paecilomyces variotii]|nr:hypothetical protein DTO032I3_6274 [Paecilomyces variotii]KAJ9205814.1 hypothetical protein DTO164E3_1067 [Paecilomyces variotii]KAJ9275248.1 hypothetical protein DTO021D3_7894 [Paecilomyces variotii]KAJ9341572.1 hypothetical protein DTO027B6_5936 [Paecilomyces variotii]KAJ9379086.1 hypothetical protein DTO032I4_7343 [Paecilomyces variotii]
MKKTLLLVFIHGFKGGDDTFVNFPEHLRALVSHALPNIDVVTAVYPKYETRGDLKECVGRFREWLQNKVIDLEVENHAPSPTVDPSVHVILVGHSMGGIVGGETLILLASEEPLPPPSSLSESSTADGKRAGRPTSVEPTTFMFPHIQGLMAFDTPFLGIAPGVVSYGAEGHLKTVATAYNTISEIASVFGFGGNNTSTTKTTSTTVQEQKSLPASTATAASADAAATPSWQRWGRYAMFAGAAGAAAAGGAAALYSQRDNLTAGWSWVTSHLAFVGCLARSEELRKRVSTLSNLYIERKIGSANFYTCLGRGAQSIPDPTHQGKSSISQKIIRSKDRTFCSLPPDVDEQPNRSDPGLIWIKATNDKSSNETTAHISMFSPKDNPAFYSLAHQAAHLVTEWVDKPWYAAATRERKKENISTANAAEDELIDSDDVVVIE